MSRPTFLNELRDYAENGTMPPSRRTLMEWATQELARLAEVEKQSGRNHIRALRAEAERDRLREELDRRAAPPGWVRVEDRNVEAVRARLAHRYDKGMSTYGVSTERTDLAVVDWLRHAQDEALDLAVYLERLKREFPPEPDEASPGPEEGE